MIPQRFWDKILPEPNSGCWLWNAASNWTGYGVFRVETNRSVMAHRFSYENLVGPIPDGLELDHLCRVRCCCNPKHLEPVTRSENTRRGIAANNGLRAHHNRRSAAPTCVHGHTFTGKNVGFRKDGRRRCRECDRIRAEEIRRSRPGKKDRT